MWGHLKGLVQDQHALGWANELLTRAGEAAEKQTENVSWFITCRTT